MRIKSGSKGKSFNDRELAGEVRSLTLKEIRKILLSDKEGDADFKKQVILKLSTSILPRLNEITGENGGAIKLEGVEIAIRK